MTERDKMIENNLGLVHSCAQKFKNRGVEYDDLFQAGCVGLVKAVDGFDETLGFVFFLMRYPQFSVKSNGFSETAVRLKSAVALKSVRG